MWITSFDNTEKVSYFCLMYIHSYIECSTYEEGVQMKNTYYKLYPSVIFETDIVGPYKDGDVYKITIKRLSYVNSY